MSRVVELDGEQRLAVESNDSMVVVAGPGSGKTRMLTEKARKLLNGGETILCLTFTRSAAKEMADRVPGLPAATIHSYCCGHVGWRESWGYDGLLHRFLMTEDKPKFTWVLLDECQDVNGVELDVVLSVVGGKVFAVGDPFQSIFGFQGALGPKAIGILGKVGCSKMELHNNYRSSRSIVDKLNKVFSRGLVSSSVKETGLTCILTRTNDTLFGVSKLLKRENIPHRIRLSAEISDVREYDVVGASALRLMTIHCSKGREFDKVILYDWAPSWEPEEMRVYYVAMARASREFKEVSTTSKLLEELR